MEYIKKYQDHSTSNPTSISQAAAVAALGASDDTIESMCKVFKGRRDLILQCLDQIPQIRTIRPQGAFYVFCDVSKIGDGATVAKQMLDDIKVAVIPGDSFGAPEYTSEAKIKDGIGRIAKWIENKVSCKV
jgi:aspartate aminotransferase